MGISSNQQVGIAVIFILIIIFFNSMLASIDSENETSATTQKPSIEQENTAVVLNENPPVLKPYCGDETCNQNESCATCPADCGNCPPPIKITTPQQPTVKEERQGATVKRTYTWHYDGDEYGLVGTFDSHTYELYQGLNHQREYDLFATSPYDNPLISSIADAIKEMADEYDAPKEDVPSIAAAFVQSLEYTSDDVTTGYDEYPRFPYETLYDNGGDCEDTSILTAAILQELGYGVVLLAPEGHMAVGVACEKNMPGYSVTYEGRRYCYLETTGEGYVFGELPEEYIGEKIQIIPLYQRPALQVSFNGTTRQDAFYTYVNVETTVVNLGSATADNVRVYVALQTSDEDKVWDQHTSAPFEIESEASTIYTITNLKAPADEIFRIYVMAYGDNAVAEEVTSEWRYPQS